ncbi:hypothetical protein ES332_A03G066900v1 [Gossypium tomentosum]|uniref:Uncharacterized protein n=1 Tax=Gossypium tomentosum TaxID=34277 RepID=A0A5D2R4K6_GOSTO|nr:hypothetical protein ES332_A03G066900v1 [Gossypium tomentosum]
MLLPPTCPHNAHPPRHLLLHDPLAAACYCHSAVHVCVVPSMGKRLQMGDLISVVPQTKHPSTRREKEKRERRRKKEEEEKIKRLFERN